jgi:N-acetylglucosamine-6-phosphate deacetylase
MDKLTIVGLLPQHGLGRVTITNKIISAVELGEFRPSDADLYFPDNFIASGFIDLQINGGLGKDFTVEPSSVYTLAEQLPRWGCTAFLPTIITSDFEAYRTSLNILKEAMSDAHGARVLGVHLEGPYLNPKYKGAHESCHLRPASLAEVKSLLEPGAIRLMTVAPELPGMTEIIKYLVAQGIIVSTGHSGATYDEAMVANLAGASYVTHLFNAMPSIHHRNPGLIAAALDKYLASQPYLGIIADGIHVHPAVLRMVMELAAERLTLVTDASAGMGMAPGHYKLGGLDIIVDENSARLDDEKRTLAGSILTIDQAVRNMMQFSNTPLPKILNLASLNPAKVLRQSHKFGQVKAGYYGDLVILDANLQVQMTLVNGNIVYEQARLAVMS